MAVPWGQGTGFGPVWVLEGQHSHGKRLQMAVGWAAPPHSWVTQGDAAIPRDLEHSAISPPWACGWHHNEFSDRNNPLKAAAPATFYKWHPGVSSLR